MSTNVGLPMARLWPSLLLWLDGHGMETSTLPVEPREITGAGYGLVAVRHIPPATRIFTVPASALLNRDTLQPHYSPNPVLSGTQLISLHLLIYRPIDHLPSTDPLFGPYISVLPTSFHAHPLTWLWKERIERNANSVESHLLALLPPRVVRDLERVARTFYADWDKVYTYLVRLTSPYRVYSRLICECSKSIHMSKPGCHIVLQKRPSQTLSYNRTFFGHG
jgi:hypothetical protein